MLLLTSTSDLLQLITASAVTVDVHASWVDFNGSTALGDRKNTKITTATTTNIVASPGASTQRNIKTLHICNIHASSSVLITVQHTDGTNVVELETVTLLPGERLSYTGEKFELIDANVIPKTNPAAAVFVHRLQSDLSNSTTTAAKVTGLDFACGVGTWIFEYVVLYQSSATTTGIKLGCNHSGTVTSFVYEMYGVETGVTAATGAMDQDALALTGQIVVGWAARTKTTTAPMITPSVDTLNADMMMRIAGLAVVTVAGNIELYHASETAVATTVKAGTALRLTKVA